MTTYSAGLRAGEVAALKPEHIDSKTMLIKVKTQKGATNAIPFSLQNFFHSCVITTKPANPKRTCSHHPIIIKKTNHLRIQRYAASMKRLAKKPGLTKAPASIPSGIALPPICLRLAATSVESRYSWAIDGYPPP